MIFPIGLCCMGQKLDAAPDFAAISNESQRKQTFFCYLAPMVEDVNARVIEQRKRLERIRREQAEGRGVDESGQRFVRKLAVAYSLRAEAVDPALVDDLLGRVDRVPVSLALAQAANESAWGTSRFAREGHNYFGQWCYRKGCGMVPRKRPKGGTYEVQRFADARQSVAAFIDNLNTNSSYASFRSIRSKERKQDRAVSGLAAAEGLRRYSGRGDEYVKTLQEMIRFDRLEAFDTRSGAQTACRVEGARAAP